MFSLNVPFPCQCTKCGKGEASDQTDPEGALSSAHAGCPLVLQGKGKSYVSCVLKAALQDKGKTCVSCELPRVLQEKGKNRCNTLDSTELTRKINMCVQNAAVAKIISWKKI